MIFCFSGTGNSLHVAEQIQKKTDEKIVMITKAEMNLHRKYVLKSGERLGIISPVYWWGLPTFVEKFINEMQLEYDQLTYVYGVATYGMVGNNEMSDLKKCLSKHNINLNATFEVKMVDNYIVGYELVDKEKQNRILKSAEKKIEYISDAVLNKQEILIKNHYRVIKPMVHEFYKSKDHSQKFYVTKDCIHCGKCQQECPSGAITMNSGTPQWNQNCAFCQKCIHCCPKQAIQYGKTEGRARYYYHS